MLLYVFVPVYVPAVLQSPHPAAPGPILGPLYHQLQPVHSAFRGTCGTGVCGEGWVRSHLGLRDPPAVPIVSQHGICLRRTPRSCAVWLRLALGRPELFYRVEDLP